MLRNSKIEFDRDSSSDKVCRARGTQVFMTHPPRPERPGSITLRCAGRYWRSCSLWPGDTVKLTVVHDIEWLDPKFIQDLSNGWPMILASLKSLIDTGESLEATRSWPKGM